MATRRCQSQHLPLRSVGLALGVVIVVVSTAEAALERPTVLGRSLAKCESRFDVPSSENITSIDQVVPLPAGGAVALDRSQSRLYLFGSSGRFVRGIGRSGEGPGEFDTPTTAGLWGDQIWVGDQGLRRFTLFRLDGDLIRTLNPADLLSAHSAVPFELSAILADGRALLYENGTYDVGEQVRAHGRLLVVGNLTGSKIDTLARLSYRDGFLVVRLERGDGMFGMDQPWASNDLHNVSPDGRYVVQVALGKAKDGRAGVEVQWLRHPSGKNVKANLSLSVAPLSDRAVSDWIRRLLTPRLLEHFVSPASAERAVRLQLVRPAFEPAVRRVLVSTNGEVWLARDELQQVWDVVDVSGQVRGNFVGPSGMRLLAVGRRYAWGVEKDADDVPTLCRYPLSLSTSSSAQRSLPSMK